MHILCTICSDLVNQAESLHVTKCGHIFHQLCLAEWIKRSKSCPQCRNKVTDKCMFRMYPTVSNDTSGTDAATLQSRLDDAMLQLRTQAAGHKELQEQLAAAKQDLEKKNEALKSKEKQLVSRESAVAALREQLEYVRLQNKDTERLREENDRLKKNLQTLNGLQKVLNATAGEVEETLRGYSDLRTLATFAAALKRALCDSEAKKRSCRALQHGAEQRLAAQRARHDDLLAKLQQVQESLSLMERKYEALKHKRKASADADADGDGHGARDAKLAKHDASVVAGTGTGTGTDTGAGPGAAARTLCDSLNEAVVYEDLSFGSAVTGIVQSDSPYLNLKQSGLALRALQQRRPQPLHLKPSELALLKSSRAAPTSIFHAPSPPSLPAPAPSPEPYDGLGGHSQPDVFPTPTRPLRPLVPRLSSKHKLKRFHSAGSRDIGQMFADLQNK